MGVGGNDSWSYLRTVGENYYVKPDQLVAFSFRMSPLSPGGSSTEAAHAPQTRPILTSGCQLVLKALPPAPSLPPATAAIPSAGNPFYEACSTGYLGLQSSHGEEVSETLPTTREVVDEQQSELMWVHREVDLTGEVDEGDEEMHPGVVHAEEVQLGQLRTGMLSGAVGTAAAARRGQDGAPGMCDADRRGSGMPCHGPGIRRVPSLSEEVDYDTADPGWTADFAEGGARPHSYALTGAVEAETATSMAAEGLAGASTEVCGD